MVNQATPDHLVELVLFVSILAPIVTAVTEVIKRTLPKLPPRYSTLLAVFVAIGLSSVAWVFTDLNTTFRLWGGLIAGLVSAKLYDVTKDLAGRFKK